MRIDERARLAGRILPVLLNDHAAHVASTTMSSALTTGLGPLAIVYAALVCVMRQFCTLRVRSGELGCVLSSASGSACVRRNHLRSA